MAQDASGATSETVMMNKLETIVKAVNVRVMAALDHRNDREGSERTCHGSTWSWRQWTYVSWQNLIIETIVKAVNVRVMAALDHRNDREGSERTCHGSTW